MKQPGETSSESAHQQYVFAYCAVAYRYGWAIADNWTEDHTAVTKAEPDMIDALEWVHHVPNGGARADDDKGRQIRGGKLRAEGVRSGVADIHLPWPHAGYPGLYIEMKRPSEKSKTGKGKGGMSDDQIKFKEYCIKVGYGFATCYSWKEAVDVLKSYINYER